MAHIIPHSCDWGRSSPNSGGFHAKMKLPSCGVLLVPFIFVSRNDTCPNNHRFCISLHLFCMFSSIFLPDFLWPVLPKFISLCCRLCSFCQAFWILRKASSRCIPSFSPVIQVVYPYKPYEQKYVVAFRNPIQPDVQATPHCYQCTPMQSRNYAIRHNEKMNMALDSHLLQSINITVIFCLTYLFSY